MVPEPIYDHLMAFNGTGLIKGSLLGYSKPVAIKPLKQIWFVQEPITFGLYGYIRLSHSRSLGFLVWCGRTRSLALHAPRSYDRASRSQSRYALKSSTCEQVYGYINTMNCIDATYIT